MKSSILDHLEMVLAFSVCVLVSCYFLFNGLTSSTGLSFDSLVLIFLLPSVGIVGAFFAATFPPQSAKVIRAVLLGYTDGISLGFGLLGLVVLFAWYNDPDNGKLEPLSIILGLFSGGTIVSVKKIIKDSFRDKGDSA